MFDNGAKNMITNCFTYIRKNSLEIFKQNFRILTGPRYQLGKLGAEALVFATVGKKAVGILKNVQTTKSPKMPVFLALFPRS